MIKKTFNLLFIAGNIFAYCEAGQLTTAYNIDSDWGTGYQVTVTLTNPSSTPTTSWSATFNLESSQEKISSLWNGNYIASGTQISVANPSWTGGGTIPAGGSISFGFVVYNSLAQNRTLLNLQATANGINPPPPPSLTAPVLQPVNNGGSYQFQLQWNAIQNAQGYKLQQSTCSDFSTAQTIYSGTSTTYTATVTSTGIYYYRVMAYSGTIFGPVSNTVTVNVTQTPPVSKAVIEAYWESWNSQDSLDAIVNMKVDVIDISFINFTTTGNHTYIVSGLDCNQTTLTQFITKAHNAGKKVKVSVGGATYGLSGQLLTVQDAQGMAQAIATFVQQNNLDGVDFDIEDYPAANLQIALLQNTRQLLGNNALISYTPKTPASTTLPYSTVIQGAYQYLNTISMMAYDAYTGYNYQTDVQALLNMGVPASKIVVGLMPGKDDIGKMTSLADITAAGQFVLQKGLGGLMFWDLDRDYENITGLGASAATNTAWGVFH